MSNNFSLYRGRMPNLDSLLISEDINKSIIEIDNFTSGFSDINELSNPQKIFHYVQELEREVNNGGFNQYFWNSSGDYAMDTVEALKAIGANKTATIVQKAIDRFPNANVPVNKDEREELVEKIEETANPVWNELDQKFFLYEDDINTLNIEFIKKNRTEF